MCWTPHSFPPPNTKTAFLWHHVSQAYESVCRGPDSCAGDQMAKGVMRASLVLTHCHVPLLRLCWGHHHAVLAPPWEEMLWWSPPWAQAACSQSRAALKGHFGQDGHTLQCGLARPAAEGRKSALVRCCIWSVATSTKHQFALLFRQVKSWEGAEVWDEFSWLKTAKISLGFTMSHWNLRKAIHQGNQEE